MIGYIIAFVAVGYICGAASVIAWALSVYKNGKEKDDESV